MVEAAQFDQLAQQVRTLAEAVQNLQGVVSRAPQRAQEPLLPERSPVLLNPRSFFSHGEERRREEDSRARSIRPGPSHRSCAGYERRARARSQPPSPQGTRAPVGPPLGAPCLPPIGRAPWTGGWTISTD